MLILKFQYVSLSTNPSTTAAKILILILKNCKRIYGINKYADYLKTEVRKYFRIFTLHIFQMSQVKFKEKKVKMQGYTLAACLTREARTHLELVLVMVKFDEDLASKVDSYLFQIVVYWSLQVMNDSYIITLFLNFLKQFLAKNTIEKSLASILRFHIFSCLNDIAEAYNLKTKPDPVYDSRNAFWVLTEIMKVINDYVRTHSMNPVIVMNFSSNRKFNQLNELVEREYNVMP